MSEQTDNIIELLKPYGLSSEEANIYMYLLENGSSSALAISRKVGMARTKVYRILDKLIGKELVVPQVGSSGYKFVASEPLKLEMELARREGEIVGLRKNLPNVIKMLEIRSALRVPGSKTLYYRGKKGLSAVNWNLLKAKGQVLSYEVATANAYMPQTEAEKLRKEIVDKKIMIRTLTNKTRIEPFTQVTELVKKWNEVRCLPEDLLAIKMDVFIYNEVMTICHYLDDGDVFCLEIYNQFLVDMQCQIFEILWGQASQMRVIKDNGEARVVEK